MKHQRNANSARKPSPKGRRIQRRGVAERRQLLDRYERSGLSQKAFCLRHGVALSTLQYWRRRARDMGQEPTPSFVEIPQVTGMAQALSVEAAVFIDLERLAISPQCGFATSVVGNALTQDDERAKLETIARASAVIWG